MDNTTGRRMNVLLKFSWGHILASLAVIATAYGTFVGLTYRLGGGYIVPGVITFVVSLVLVLSFSTLQRLKGTDSGFAACIRRERILFFSFPFILCVLMVPFMHSLTVHSREDAIRTRFEQSIQDSRKMFDSYEEYSRARCDRFREAVKKKKLTQVQQDNRVRALEASLLYYNEQELRKRAEDWIGRSSGNISTWNIFLLGSIDRTEAALMEWHGRLEELSRVSFKGEELDDEYWFDPGHESLDEAIGGLESLRELYVKGGFNPLSILAVLAVWLMLMLPYFLQRRHSRNWYTLFPSGRRESRWEASRHEDDCLPEDAGGKGAGATNAGGEDAGDEDAGSEAATLEADEDDLGSFTL